MRERLLGRPGTRLLLDALRPGRAAYAPLAGWSLVESMPALLSGKLIALALDRGFLAARPTAGIGWLVALAAGGGAGAHLGGVLGVGGVADVVQRLDAQLLSGPIVCCRQQALPRPGVLLTSGRMRPTRQRGERGGLADRRRWLATTRSRRRCWRRCTAPPCSPGRSRPATGRCWSTTRSR